VLYELLKYDEEQYSSRQISELTGCSKTTVRGVINRGAKQGVTYKRALELGTNGTAWPAPKSFTLLHMPLTHSLPDASVEPLL
jgi:hypothetical protein